MPRVTQKRVGGVVVCLLDEGLSVGGGRPRSPLAPGPLCELEASLQGPGCRQRGGRPPGGGAVMGAPSLGSWAPAPDLAGPQDPVGTHADTPSRAPPLRGQTPYGASEIWTSLSRRRLSCGWRGPQGPAGPTACVLPAAPTSSPSRSVVFHFHLSLRGRYSGRFLGLCLGFPSARMGQLVSPLETPFLCCWQPQNGSEGLGFGKGSEVVVGRPPPPPAPGCRHPR